MLSCSICIPTYKRQSSLAMCLSSLLGFLPDYRVDSVLVAVTGEAAESIGYMAESLLKTIEFAGTPVTVQDGFNGLLDAKEWFPKESDSEILLILDDDAVINVRYLDLLSHFSSYRRKNRSVAAVSGSLQTPLDVGHYTDWSAEPIQAPTKETVCNRVRMDGDLVVIDDKYQVYMLDKQRVYDCEVLVGTALFIRKNLLCIDRRFELGKYYYEEYDFTYWLHRSGYRLLYDSSRVAWHIRDPKGGMRAIDGRDKAVNGKLFKDKYGL